MIEDFLERKQKDQTELTFTLFEDEIEKLKVWKESQMSKSIEIQKAKVSVTDQMYDIFKKYWDYGFPYDGAVGGIFEYKFIPTNLGRSVLVRNSITGDEIDLTDYDW